MSQSSNLRKENPKKLWERADEKHLSPAVAALFPPDESEETELPEHVSIELIEDSHHPLMGNVVFTASDQLVSVYVPEGAELGEINLKMVKDMVGTGEGDWKTTISFVYDEYAPPPPSMEVTCRWYTPSAEEYGTEGQIRGLGDRYDFDRLKDVESTCTSKDMIMRLGDQAPRCRFEHEEGMSSCPFYEAFIPEDVQESSIGGVTYALQRFRVGSALHQYRIVKTGSDIAVQVDRLSTSLPDEASQLFNDFLARVSGETPEVTEIDTEQKPENFFDHVNIRPS